MKKPFNFVTCELLVATALVLTTPLSRAFAAEALTPDAAAKALGELKNLKGGSEVSFDAVTGMARRLTDDELHKLSREVGVGRTEGMRGWVRAAVLAEWGRRDFNGVMQHLSKVAQLDSGHQQALYAVFRGSRPAEDAPALAHLKRMFTDYPSATGAFTRGWAKRALEDVFGELARSNPERGWRLLTTDGEDGPEQQVLNFLTGAFNRLRKPMTKSHWVAMESFFAGLPDLDSVRTYAAKFEKLWNTPEVIAALKVYNAQDFASGGSMGWTPPPRQEGVASVVAISMVRFDLEAGIDWIANNGPDKEREKSGRIGHMLTYWAWANPGKAITFLKGKAHPEWNETVVMALMRGDASRALEVAGDYGKEPWIGRALSGAFPAAATMMDMDYFPVPGKNEVLPSHKVRYDFFVEAIKNCPLSEKVRQDVTRSLNNAFQYTVDDALKAYQLAQEK